MTLYRALLRPLLFQLDPEVAHGVVLSLLAVLGAPGLVELTRLMSGVPASDDSVALGALRLPNRLGIAAGVDKDGTAIPALAALGFGSVEVGTVTPRPQPGNPRPRVFRFPQDRTLINRMGFPSRGMHFVAEQLRKARTRCGTAKIGINIGKNKETPLEDAASDYVQCFETLSPYADYVAINVSSPNTPELRKLQEPERLTALLGAIAERNQRGVPIFVKLSPDLTAEELDQLIPLLRTSGITGIIATNTTLSREGLREATEEACGLSGPLLHQRSVRCVAAIRQMVGPAFPIIGVGGIHDAASCRTMLAAGADAVQLYTGVVYEGPALARRLLCELSPAK
jgi:dihydroorotate dehydrogenase